MAPVTEIISSEVTLLNIKDLELNSKPQEIAQKFVPHSVNQPTDPKVREICLRPFEYVRALPSKNIRRKVAKAFNYWYKVDDEELDEAMKAVDYLHNASLVIDDIEDGSDTRRGAPAAHLVYGIAQSINAANLVYFQVIVEAILKKDTKNRVTETERLSYLLDFAKTMVILHEGQGMELFWREENMKEENSGKFHHVPTLKDYEQISVKKTTAQFSMLARAFSQVGNKKVDIEYLGTLIGLHFQIRDDLLNLISKTYEAGKGFCEDFTEGKFSYPVIYALDQRSDKDKDGAISNKEASRLLEILRLRTQDVKLKQEALEIVRKSGALDFTKNKLKEIKTEIQMEILRLGGNPIFTELKHEIFADDF